jgi:hypothetical protein
MDIILDLNMEKISPLRHRRGTEHIYLNFYQAHESIPGLPKIFSNSGSGVLYLTDRWITTDKNLK